MEFSNYPVDPASLPRAQDQPFHPLSSRYLWVTLSSQGIQSLILLVVGIGAWHQYGTESFPAWTALVLGLAWLLWVGGRILIALKGFSRKKYALREKDLTYQKGLLNYQAISLPFNRVQHAEVGQGVLERAFGLAHLKVFTAGGSSSDLRIPGITMEEANRLKDFILSQAEQSTPTSHAE